MSALFALLFLAALVFLVWGLIRPASFNRFARKPMTRKEAGIGFGLIALLFFVLTGITAPPQQSSNVAKKNDTANQELAKVKAEETKKAPVIVTKTVLEMAEVPFGSQTTENASWNKGVSKVTTVGVNGVKTFTYEVTLKDGVQTDKKLVKEEITTNPVDQVTTIGTKVAAPKPVAKPTPPPPTSSCDPNYSGCVPIASDVDCAGGSGNGPAYVSGPVTVIGSDIYRLDADNDGVGCE